MDLMISFAVGQLAHVSYGIDLLGSRHLARKDVLHRNGNVVSISGTPFHSSCDGEVVGPISDRTWRVEKSAFEMTLPDET